MKSNWGVKMEYQKYSVNSKEVRDRGREKQREHNKTADYIQPYHQIRNHIFLIYYCIPITMHNACYVKSVQSISAESMKSDYMCYMMVSKYTD